MSIAGGAPTAEGRLQAVQSGDGVFASRNYVACFVDARPARKKGSRVWSLSYSARLLPSEHPCIRQGVVLLVSTRMRVERDQWSTSASDRSQFFVTPT